MGARLKRDPEVREGLATLVGAQQLLSLLVDAGTGVSAAPEPSTSAGVRSAADRLVEIRADGFVELKEDSSTPMPAAAALELEAVSRLAAIVESSDDAMI